MRPKFAKQSAASTLCPQSGKGKCLAVSTMFEERNLPERKAGPKASPSCWVVRSNIFQWPPSPSLCQSIHSQVELCRAKQCWRYFFGPMTGRQHSSSERDSEWTKPTNKRVATQPTTPMKSSLLLWYWSSHWQERSPPQKRKTNGNTPLQIPNMPGIANSLHKHRLHPLKMKVSQLMVLLQLPHEHSHSPEVPSVWQSAVLWPKTRGESFHTNRPWQVAHIARRKTSSRIDAMTPHDQFPRTKLARLVLVVGWWVLEALSYLKGTERAMRPTGRHWDLALEAAISHLSSLAGICSSPRMRAKRLSHGACQSPNHFYHCESPSVLRTSRKKSPSPSWLALSQSAACDHKLATRTRTCEATLNQSRVQKVCTISRRQHSRDPVLPLSSATESAECSAAPCTQPWRNRFV